MGRICQVISTDLKDAQRLEARLVHTTARQSAQIRITYGRVLEARKDYWGKYVGRWLQIQQSGQTAQRA